jgi:hypothetical protein
MLVDDIDRLDHSIARLSVVAAAMQCNEEKESFGMLLILRDIEMDLVMVKEVLERIAAERT